MNRPRKLPEGSWTLRKDSAHHYDFRDYESMAKKNPPLTRIKERWLVALAQMGDGRAQEKLLFTYIKMIMKFASKRTEWLRMPIEDLVDYGVLGFLKGIQGFDPFRGNRLSTYAIRAASDRMQKAWADWQTIKPPKFGTVQKSMARTVPAVSASVLAEVGSDEPMSWDDLFPDCRDELDHDQAQRISAVRKWLAEVPLKDRERSVLRRRFGFDGDEETLATISETYGLTKERIRQLEADGLNRLVAHKAKLARGIREP